MLIDFFFHLRQAKLKVSINELLTLLDALKHGCHRSVDRRVLLPVSRGVGQGRNTVRPLRSRLWRIFSRRADRDRLYQGNSGRVVQADARAHVLAGRDCEARKARLGQADGRVSQAAGGAGRRASRRQQVDRLRRHVTVRPRRRASRRDSRWRPIQGRQVGRQGMGDARLPRLRRFGRDRDAQHQGRAAAAAPLRARRRRTRTRHARHDRVDREKRRLARSEAGARSGTTPSRC